MPYQVVIPKVVKKLMIKLLDSGYKVFIVGGSVRDQILKREVQDYDITTSANPDQIIKVFKGYKVMNFGAKHGTITVNILGTNYEITTFRTDGEYSDGRRPDTVKFVVDLVADLSRRDFTMNAIAADINGNIHDPFNGLSDIKNKILRAVGDAYSRFEEDSLRIIRACRFSLRYNYTIEENTWSAIKQAIPLLRKHSISPERIANEMKEIVLHQDKAIKLLFDLGIIDILFPSLSNANFSDTLDTLSKLQKSNLKLNLAVLFKNYLTSVDKRNQKKYFDNLMKNLVGYGRYAEEYIFLLSINGIVPDTIIQNRKMNECIRWIERITSKISRKKEFIITEFISDIIEITRTSEKNIDDLGELLLQSYNLATIKVPANGEDAKKLGFKGKQISDILRQWQLITQRNPDVTHDDLISYVFSFRENPILNIVELRKQISDNRPNWSDEEYSVIKSEIERLCGLFQNKTLILQVNPIEMKYLSKEKFRYNNFISIEILSV